MTNNTAIDYDKIASVYAHNRNTSPHVVAHVLQGADEYKALNYAILEVGCGTANYLSALSQGWGARGYGFDSSAEMIREARQKYRGLNLKVGDANLHFPYPKSVFNFAFSIDVIHYIKNPENYYAEAFRVLDEKGVVLTITDSTEDIMTRTLSCYFPETVQQELQRYHTIPTLEAAMKKAGFQDLQVTHIQHEREISPDDIEKIRNKAFSALRLISETDFQVGLRRLVADQDSGNAIRREVYTFLWGRKSERKGL